MKKVLISFVFILAVTGLVLANSSDPAKAMEGWQVKGDFRSLEMKPAKGSMLDENIEIEITPDEPIVIPGEGDWFEVGVYIENLTGDDVWFDAWMDVELPWGYSFELVCPVELMLPAGFMFEGSIWLYMPFFAPEGEYSLTAYVGDYPDDIWDQDNLTVIKEEWQWPDAATGWQVQGDFSSLAKKPAAGPMLDENIEIEITPDDPIVIPGEGDWFEVGVYIENLTGDDVWFDAWMDVELPWGYSFELVCPVELMLPAGFMFEGSIWLYMPFFAPEGEYSLTAYVGDYPDDIWDQDNLTVIKEEWQWPDAMKGWQVKGDFIVANPIPIEEPTVDEGIEIDILPDEPIVMPEEGGWFMIEASIENTTADTVWFDAWMDVELPFGWSFEIVPPFEFWLPGGYYSGGELWLWMPWFAPEGTYSFTAYVGDYPDDIWDEDNLTVIKEAGDAMGLKSGNLATTPNEFTVSGFYPNPFNPTTTLSFSLPDAELVNLTVYDMAGRTVATLIDGWRAAGTHDVTFDASNLASGVYFYTLMAGDYKTQGKMLLVK